MRETRSYLSTTDFPAIRRRGLRTLQMNLGYLCNLSCIHCHVAAGPNRRELMDRATIDTAIDFMARQPVDTLDLTGGSPEMNPHFRDLVRAARERGVHVMDRCNPTILDEPGYDWIAGFLAEHRVEVVASLPCYSEGNVDAQRGRHVFERSVAALRRFNRLGYGRADTGLTLNLVYNPLGAALPPPQAALEDDYHAHLWAEHGVEFNHLFTIANMPIKRFGSMLLSRGEFDDYMTLLKNAYRRENLADVMCRDLISVDWRGRVYDCDFNQMLGMPLGAGASGPTHLVDLLDHDLAAAPIHVAEHCYACTAGQGSSCGGALKSSP
ncbi:arsenosugar biosynthesis radical SAM (seleno)protein ArsS [Salinisphaera sp.]|uniref:arsenosugar biosynthesis radical SAM (seleno)protein ArsS n=1 Tax=Salinisphaera sp. TaxID=1914330 RepID=UPI002D771077|nr:arsenosugar biosynthesis radical SAM (seleno)protein ArsS [Salinisphaera sp.]HET7312850.1 arsenosugar biosynthesis radical SAM (seleno)protein ArsS [Salinisphaera sp.]